MRLFLRHIRRWFKSSIKLQIIASIGSVISVLMIAISIGVLLQWRNLIINQQTENSISFIQAFSIQAIETIIQNENSHGTSNNMLETHIQNFMENVDGIHYISIQDNTGRIIAHNDLAQYGQLFEGPELTETAAATQTPRTRIYRTDQDWVMEALMPLQIGNKRWGSVVMGFDASPMRNQIEESFFLLLVLTLIAIIVTLALLYYFIDRVMSSLRTLVNEVDKIDLDSYESSSFETRSDEIGYLIEHFEMLKKRLNESRNQLESAQHQIYQAEKLASIGRLASGVAHEVNNPLNGMRFCVYSIENDIDNHDKTREYLALINEGLAQIESVVTKLLGYSRQRPKTPEVIQPVRHIKIVLDLLEYRIKEKNVSVSIKEEPDLPILKADPNLVQEMLMNLILNSLDAVGKNGIVDICIKSSAHGNLEIIVYDNGVGIPESEQKKIFDPFYSTKDTGEGTGLGLSVTLGIVEAHNGNIRVESKPGAGTTFTITLPAAEA